MHQAGEHTSNILDLPGKRNVQLARQEPQVPGKKQIILKFVARTQRVTQEASEVGV